MDCANSQIMILALATHHKLSGWFGCYTGFVESTDHVDLCSQLMINCNDTSDKCTFSYHPLDLWAERFSLICVCACVCLHREQPSEKWVLNCLLESQTNGLSPRFAIYSCVCNFLPMHT